MNNPQNRNTFQDDITKNNASDCEKKIDQFTFQQIEFYLQQQVNNFN